MDESKIPPVSDPIWAQWAAPLLEFISQGPKDWKAIHVWRRQVKMNEELLRNCLAWLEKYHHVRCLDDGKGGIRWVAHAWSRRPKRATKRDAMDEVHLNVNKAPAREGLVR